MKKCPFCAEEIQDDALKCRFCGEFFKDGVKKIPWVFRTSSIVLMTSCIGPFVLPVILINPHYSWAKRITISLIIIGVSYALYTWLQSYLNSMGQYYDIILKETGLIF